MKPNYIIYSLLFFFVFSNFYSVIVIFTTGYLDSSYPGYKVENFNLVIQSAIYISLFYFYIFYLFVFSSKIKNSYSMDAARNSGNYKAFSLLVIFLQFVFLYAILVEGAGVAGGVDNPNRTIISSFFAIFRVDDFVFMYLIAFGALFRINFVLFFVNFILRGWLSVFICIILILVSRCKINFKSLSFYFLFFLGFVLIALMSVMLEIRNFYRLNSSLDVESVINIIQKVDFDIVSIFLFSMHEILMRFQQVESLVYFMENKDIFENFYRSNLVTPVYFDGPIISFIYGVFHDTDSVPLGFYLADHSRELVIGRKTAMSPGLITYVLLDYITLVYITLVPFVFGYFTTFFKNKNFRIVMVYFLFIYFSFGWSNAVVGVTFTSIIFIFCSLFFSGKVVIRHVRKVKV